MAARSVALTTTAVLLGTTPSVGGYTDTTITIQNTSPTEALIDVAPGSGSVAMETLAAASATTPGGEMSDDKPGVSWYGWVASGTGSVDVDFI